MTEEPVRTTAAHTGSASRRFTVRALGAGATAFMATLGIARAVNADDVASQQRRKRRGRRGPPGPRGPAGPAGPGRTTLFADARNLDSEAGSRQTAEANCPNDQILVGGGFDTGVDDGSVVVTRALAVPDPHPSQYSVNFVRVTAAANDSEVTAYAVCAPGDD